MTLFSLFIFITAILGFFTTPVRDPLYLVAAAIACVAMSYAAYGANKEKGNTENGNKE